MLLSTSTAIGKLGQRCGARSAKTCDASGDAAVHAHDALVRIEEQIGHADALIEQSAGIGAQIEDQRLMPASRSESIARPRSVADSWLNIVSST